MKKSIMFGSQSHKKEGTENIKRRGILLIFFLVAFGLSLFAQSFPTNRYYQVILRVDGVETKLSQHITQMNAEAKLNCRDGYVIPPTGKTLGPDTMNCPKYLPASKTDTIKDLMFAYGNVKSPKFVVLYNCTEKLIASKEIDQNIPNHQFTVRLQRLRNFEAAETTYKLIDTPFYFIKGDSIVSKTDSTITLRTFASNTHCIFQYVNGIKINTAEFCTPGLANLNGVNVFRHTHRNLPYDPTKPMLYKFEAIDEKTREVLGVIEYAIEP